MFQVDEKKPAINRLFMENFKREIFHWAKVCNYYCASVKSPNSKESDNSCNDTILYPLHVYEEDSKYL